MVLMMVQVLEKQEALRVKRFEELGRLLVDLRYVSGIGLSNEFPLRPLAHLCRTLSRMYGKRETC